MATCIYCNYKRATGKAKVHARRFVNIKLSFFSPITKEKIEKTYCICCSRCRRKYEKLKMKDLSWIRTKLLPKEVALVNFQTIFDNVNFETVFESVIGIAKFDDTTYQVIFKICNIRAYLDLRKIEQAFTVVAVERMY